MKLYCKKCNELLTLNTLRKVKVEDVSLEDEIDLLPYNKFIEAYETEYNFEVSIDYLLNTESINLENHKDRSRFTGCCGSSQLKNLNQVCPNCKNEIGLIVDDCWTSRFTGIDASKISLKPLW